MARPQKIGVEYFPLDVDIDQDDKIAMVEAIHGIEGFGVIIKLLMKIYKEGYYYEWTEREQILFSRRVNVDINQVNVIINDSIKWGLFDKRLFDEYEILTSRGIQTRYLEIVKRRTKVEIISEFILIAQNLAENMKNIVIVDINGVIADINSKNADIGTQSKVKESKVKESKVNNNNGSSCPQKHVDKFLDDNIAIIAKDLEQNGFGTISLTVKDMIVSLVKDYTVEWVREAIKIAVTNNKRKLSYVEGILQNWRKDGGIKNKQASKHKYSDKRSFDNFSKRQYNSEELKQQLLAKSRGDYQ